jgi:hypothetical protein
MKPVRSVVLTSAVVLALAACGSGATSDDADPSGRPTAPATSALGYYAPGNDLVLYYGDQSYHNGIVVLGRMHGDAARRIATMEGSIKVLLQA